MLRARFLTSASFLRNLIMRAIFLTSASGQSWRRSFHWTLAMLSKLLWAPTLQLHEIYAFCIFVLDVDVLYWDKDKYIVPKNGTHLQLILQLPKIVGKNCAIFLGWWNHLAILKDQHEVGVGGGGGGGGGGEGRGGHLHHHPLPLRAYLF